MTQSNDNRRKKMANPIVQSLALHSHAANIDLSPSREGFSALVVGFSTTMRTWAARSQQRRALRDLADCDGALADIGLTRRQAYREGAKWFWQE